MNVKVISTIAFFLLSMSSGVLHAGQYAGATKVKLAKEGYFSLKASQSQYIREHQYEIVDAAQVGDCGAITKHYYRIMDAGQIDADTLMKWYEDQSPKKRRSDYGKHVFEVLISPDIMVNSRLFVICNKRLKSAWKQPKWTGKEIKASKVRVQKAVDEVKACGAAYGRNVFVNSDATSYLSSDAPDITRESAVIESLQSECDRWKRLRERDEGRVNKAVDKFLSCAKKYEVDDAEVPEVAVKFLSNLKDRDLSRVEKKLKELCVGFSQKRSFW